MVRQRSGVLVLGGVLAVLGLVLATGLSGSAQDATPATGGGLAHPAHIHTGTCDELGDVVFPLTDVAAGTMSGTPAAEGGAIAVETSETEVAETLETITQGGHAINIHLSTEEIGTYIACGDIGGVVMTGTTMGDVLAIGLREVGGSGYSGVATLQAQGEQTLVTIFLTQNVAGGTGTAAEGPPVVGAPDAGTVMVDIQNFAYTPDPVTIPVGGTITWTNRDPEPHTATARDRAVLQSGTLKQDERYTETFETAGTYEYFCEFHPNMKGTLVVE